MRKQYLAVLDDGTTYIEESEAAIARVISQGLTEPVYYRIEVDADTNEPTLTSRIRLGNAPRTTVKRIERVELEDGSGRVVGAANLEQNV